MPPVSRSDVTADLTRDRPVVKRSASAESFGLLRREQDGELNQLAVRALAAVGEVEGGGADGWH